MHTERRIEAAILARLGDVEIASEYPGLSPNAIRQHRHKCLPQVLEHSRGGHRDF
jgi:hypothetical protein